MKLILAGLEIRILKMFSVQVNHLAVLRPTKTKVVLLVVDQIPKFFGEKFFVFVDSVLVLVVKRCLRLVPVLHVEQVLIVRSLASLGLVGNHVGANEQIFVHRFE